MKHLSCALVLGSLLLTSSQALAQSTAKVTVTFVVSKKTPSFTDQRLVVMLYHDFPAQDDRGDKAVARHIDAKFSHEKGKDTVVTVTLGNEAKLNREVQYHVTVTVFDKASKRILVGTIDNDLGPFNVLTNGAPSKLKVSATSAK